MINVFVSKFLIRFLYFLNGFGDSGIYFQLCHSKSNSKGFESNFLLIVTVLIFVGITNSVLSNGPKGIISLFSKFNLRPDMISNYLKSSMNACNESIS